MVLRGWTRKGQGNDAQNVFSHDTVMEVLSNQRRRFVMHYLKWKQIHKDGPSTGLNQLTRKIASWENNKSVEALSAKERNRVQNALRQFHLPKMAEKRFIEYDASERLVRLTEPAANCDFYLDVVPQDGISWGVYYTGICALSTVSLLGVMGSFYPFTIVTPMMLSVFLVCALAFSAFAHVYDTKYRMRLGAQQRPAELNQN